MALEVERSGLTACDSSVPLPALTVAGVHQLAEIAVFGDGLGVGVREGMRILA